MSNGGLLDLVSTPTYKGGVLSASGDACDAYGELFPLLRFRPVDPQTCGGRLLYTCEDLVTVRIEIQPIAEELLVEMQGHDVDARYSFWFNPKDPHNIAANGGAPLYLRSSKSPWRINDFDASAIQGHGDVIEYLGQKLIICDLKIWSGENCSTCQCPEDVQNISMIEGTLALWAGDYGEREATKDVDTFATEQELQS